MWDRRWPTTGCLFGAAGQHETDPLTSRSSADPFGPLWPPLEKSTPDERFDVGPKPTEGTRDANREDPGSRHAEHRPAGRKSARDSHDLHLRDLQRRRRRGHEAVHLHVDRLDQLHAPVRHRVRWQYQLHPRSQHHEIHRWQVLHRVHRPDERQLLQPRGPFWHRGQRGSDSLDRPDDGESRRAECFAHLGAGMVPRGRGGQDHRQHRHRKPTPRFSALCLHRPEQRIDIVEWADSAWNWRGLHRHVCRQAGHHLSRLHQERNDTISGTCDRPEPYRPLDVRGQGQLGWMGLWVGRTSHRPAG